MTAIDIRAIKTTELSVEAFPEVQQGFRVVIAEEALDRCVERGTADMSREIGGVLVGVVLKDESGPYLRVDDTVDALHAEEKGAELTFTHETWDYINNEMDTKHTGKTIVGWYHTHPGFGVFLSDRDEFIHKSFFDLPFQVALVYDPKSREQGVFAWGNGALVRMNRYWIGKREHTWIPTLADQPAGQSEVKAVAAVAAVGDGEPYDNGRIDWGATAMLGMVLLLVGGFGGWWMGSMSGAQKQSQMQGQLLEAKLAGAQEAVQTLDMRVMSAVRAGFDAQLTDEALRSIESHLNKASKAAGASPKSAPAGKASDALAPTPAAPSGASPPAKPEAAAKPVGGTASAAADKTPAPKKDKPKAEATSKSEVLTHIERALAIARTLGRDRGHVSATLAQLERTAAQTGFGQAEAKQLSIQRAALATLYADLSADAKKAGDSNRAKRYLDLAKTIDPRNSKRHDKQTGSAKPVPGVQR